MKPKKIFHFVYEDKMIFIILLLVISSSLWGRTYYVSPTGKDVNTGAVDKPWLTWQKAFQTAVAGDTVYFRGGVWKPSAAWHGGNNICYIKPSAGYGHNGTKGNPICFFNYPGETPVLDCSLIHTTGNYNTGINIERARFLKFKGLTLRNIYQRTANVSVVGINAYECSNFTFENIIIHNLGGRGYYFDSEAFDPAIAYDTTRWINCDVYNCVDSLGDSPGNMADGFKVNGYQKTYFYWYGCRAWRCTDDGYDLSGSGIGIWDHCWAFNMGHVNGIQGNGNGFKIGAIRDSVNYVPRIVKYCLAALCNNIKNNSAAGIEEIDYRENTPDVYRRVNGRVYNNTLYKNDIAIMANENATYKYRNTVYRNNIAYASTHVQDRIVINISINKYRYPESHNTWDLFDPRPGSWPPWFVETDTVHVTNADFESLDSTQLYLPRKADGSLPDIAFLHLVNTSDLIDKGTQIPVSDNVDFLLSYNSVAPDIGAFETTFGGSAVIPKYVNSIVDDPFPSVIEMNYNLTLSNVIPSPSAFKVQVNSVTTAVTDVQIAGNKVQLTLATTVAYGDIVTTTYTKPSSNPLQTYSGTRAENITNQFVTNKIDKSVITDVQEYFSRSKFSIYPNPLHESLNISFEEPSLESINITIRIISLSGKVFFEDKLDIGSHKVTIPIKLKPGLYFVQLNSQGASLLTRKIIVY